MATCAVNALLASALLCFIGVAHSQTSDAQATKAPKRSGWEYLPPSLQALQLDADKSPLTLWIARGEQSWQAGCTTCHGALPSMKPAVASFPKLSSTGRLRNLEDQIVACAQRLPATSPPASTWTVDSEPVLALSAALHHAARGEPIAIQTTPALQTQAQRGEALYNTRMGRMNLACVHCHDQKVGAQMRGDTISPAHPTGFPIVRQSWQTIGGMDRRLRACYSGVQAPLPAVGSEELRQLELYLKLRAQGMPLDGPSIRR